MPGHVVTVLALLPVVGGIIWAITLAGRADAHWWSVPKGKNELIALLVSWTLVYSGIRAIEASPLDPSRLVAIGVAFTLTAFGYLAAALILRSRAPKE